MNAEGRICAISTIGDRSLRPTSYVAQELLVSQPKERRRVDKGCAQTQAPENTNSREKSPGTLCAYVYV
jgi:hypothetical protein